MSILNLKQIRHDRIPSKRFDEVALGTSEPSGVRLAICLRISEKPTADLEVAHANEMVHERHPANRAALCYAPCILALLDRVHRHGVRDSLDQSRLLARDQDPEAAISDVSQE